MSRALFHEFIDSFESAPQFSESSDLFWTLRIDLTKFILFVFVTKPKVVYFRHHPSLCRVSPEGTGPVSCHSSCSSRK